MKDSYKLKLTEHLTIAKSATRTTMVKAAAGYLYGDAASFQQDCAYDSELDGENCQGQDLAMLLEKICLDIMNSNSVSVEDKLSDLETSVYNLLAFLS